MGLNFENLYGSNTFGYTAYVPLCVFSVTLQGCLITQGSRKYLLI
jgi:hypothetical protein